MACFIKSENNSAEGICEDTRFLFGAIRMRLLATKQICTDTTIILQSHYRQSVPQL